MDKQKLAEVYLQYEKLIYRVAANYSGDKGVIDDILSDTILKLSDDNVLEALNLDNRNKTRNYIATIARNTALDRLKYENRRRGYLNYDDYHKTNNDVVMDAGYYFESRENARIIIECIKNLPTIYRQVVIYKVFYNYANPYIAGLCNISEATVRKRLQRARELLSQSLTNVNISIN